MLGWLGWADGLYGPTLCYAEGHFAGEFGAVLLYGDEASRLVGWRRPGSWARRVRRL